MEINQRQLSLLEQKRLQWAKEREEMIGLCGLWGQGSTNNISIDPGVARPIRKSQSNNEIRRGNILPPIQSGKTEESHVQESEESETSGYSSDSPKHWTESELANVKVTEQQECGYSVPNSRWSDGRSWNHNVDYNDRTAEKENFWFGNNRRLDSSSERSSESWNRHRSKQYTSGYCATDSVSMGTPEDVSRAKWGDRGVGVGHLWEPVIHQPDSRLPQVQEFRQTPSWLERGLGGAEEVKADILVISHGDDAPVGFTGDKNFLLGQNLPLDPDTVAEREKKRQKALEHQNSIRKQLEERERKRREEKEKRIKEEKEEEERIQKEREIERIRYEEEQKKIKDREKNDLKKDEVMKAAIESAEKLAKEEKRKHQRKHVSIAEDENKEKTMSVRSSRENKTEMKKHRSPRTRKIRQQEEESRVTTAGPKISPRICSPGQVEKTQEKLLKDSSCQFEQLKPLTNVQFLNSDQYPIDGGLALVLDTPHHTRLQPENGLLLSHDGVQLALLMSPGNYLGSTSTNSNLTPITPSLVDTSLNLTGRMSRLHSSLGNITGRLLTPTKYRETDRKPVKLSVDQSTQTYSRYTGSRMSLYSSKKSRKHGRHSGRMSGHSDSSDKSTSLERPHHNCKVSLRTRSRSQPRLYSDERPKWGINRPTVQYKKQSEKDLNYQRRLRQRQRRTQDASTSTNKSLENINTEERLLESEMQMVRIGTDEEEMENKMNEEEQMMMLMKSEEKDDEKEVIPDEDREEVEDEYADDGEDVKEVSCEGPVVPEDPVDIILRNGYRMISNPSSPRFVPLSETTSIKSPNVDKDEIDVEIDVNLDEDEIRIGIGDKKVSLSLCGTSPDEEEDVVIPGTVGYVSRKDLDELQSITNNKQTKRSDPREGIELETEN